MKRICLWATALGLAAAPAAAMTCEQLVLDEAIAYTNGTPREKWFNPRAASAEDNARLWLKSPKGRAQIEKDRQRRRKGCV